MPAAPSRTEMLKDWALALVVAAGVFVLVGLLGHSSQREPLEGAPPFALDALDGTRLELAALTDGHPVVLNFWASWCGPCRAEIPDLARFARDYPEVRMIGLAMQSGDATEVRAAADRFGITWPVAIAPSSLSDAYGVHVLPTTVVLAEGGGVSTVHVGQMSYDQMVKALP